VNEYFNVSDIGEMLSNLVRHGQSHQIPIHYSEKRRSRGRPRKFLVMEKPVASEKNTIVDAELHTGPMVALGLLVPYNSML